MKTKQYRQCRLQRGNAVRVSWLPAQYAVEGRVLKLRDNDVWSNGWIVKDAYRESDRAVAPDTRRAVRNHRQASGDALPRRS